MNREEKIREAIAILKESKYTVAFTGAGISVESGIPPFRGAGGLWSQYDPIILDLDYYTRKPEKSWPVVKKLFFVEEILLKFPFSELVFRNFSGKFGN